MTLAILMIYLSVLREHGKISSQKSINGEKVTILIIAYSGSTGYSEAGRLPSHGQ